jgi:CRISPR system Cascade subunit CasA
MASLLAIETDGGGKRRSETTLLLRQVADLEVEGAFDMTFPLRVAIVGVTYGQQNAVVEDVIFDVLPIPVAALSANPEVRDVLARAVDEADDLRREADKLVSDLRRAAGGDPLPWNQGDHLGDAVVHDLTPSVRRLLASLQNAPDEVDAARDAWHRECQRVALAAAEPVLSAVPPSAFGGRRNGGGSFTCPSRIETRYRHRVAQIVGLGVAPDTQGNASSMEGLSDE